MDSIAFCFALLLSYLEMSTPSAAVSQMVVLRGDPVELRCSEYSADWRYYPLSYESGESDDKEISTSGMIEPTFSLQGYRIVRNETLGEMNLFIENVWLNMSGQYECRSGFDSIHALVELIVLETILDCHATPVSSDRKVIHPGKIPSDDCHESTSCSSSHTAVLNPTSNGLPKNEFIGPNTCGLEPDQILLVCEATYIGNGTPVLDLRNLKSNKVVMCSETVIEVNISRKILKCRAIMNATKDLNGAHFIYQTKHQATQTPYNFTTPPLRILYAINGDLSNPRTVQSGDQLNCTADCSQPCGHRWTWFETPGRGGKKDTECSANWVTKKMGHYSCEATCQIREHRCDVTAMYVSSIKKSEQGRDGQTTARQELTEQNVNATVIGFVVLAVVAILVAASVAFLMLRQRRNRAQALNASNQSNIELSERLSGSEPTENR